MELLFLIIIKIYIVKVVFLVKKILNLRINNMLFYYYFFYLDISKK